MKKLTLIFAALGLLLCACEKEQNSAKADDLVGEWENTLADFGQTMKFEKDGKYTQTDGTSEMSGTWELKGSDLTILSKYPEDEEMTRQEVRIKLLGGKAALVTEIEYEDEFSGKQVIHSLYYKKGAQVQSGALKDGRYDAPHRGYEIKREENYDRTFSFLVKGNELELYVHAWGEHFKGTYTIENGVLKYNITEGWHGENKEDGGWSAGDADIDFENFTFISEDYRWVTGTKDAEVFSSFPLCVSDDGKDLYMTAAGLTRWAFLR